MSKFDTERAVEDKIQVIIKLHARSWRWSSAAHVSTPTPGQHHYIRIVEAYHVGDITGVSFQATDLDCTTNHSVAIASPLCSIPLAPLGIVHTTGEMAE